ncbi:hypothetical protein [Halalkalibacter urbisdiaboli]|uniref:hypothetical protein n=1 Tax=Halalkalibacter urbisdiaboli TaxID=1960589 RepID=UPI000B441C48|nr:hypothetical protein [Halalkalibacter urbisdiaboli]
MIIKIISKLILFIKISGQVVSLVGLYFQIKLVDSNQKMLIEELQPLLLKGVMIIALATILENLIKFFITNDGDDTTKAA